MIRLIIFLTLLITLFSFGCTQSITNKSQTLFRQAKMFLKSGDTQKAQEQVDSAIFLDNSVLEYFVFRGDLLCQTNHFQEGLNDFNHVISIKPSNYDARDFRAIAYMVHGDYDKSIIDHKFLIKNYPDSINSYTGIGMTYNHMGSWDSAIYYLNISINKDANRMWTYEELATAYHQKRDYNKSIEIINNACDKGLVSLALLNLRGYNYIQIKNYPLAEKDFKTIINVNVNDNQSKYPKAMAMNNLGYVEYVNKNYVEALKWINLSLKQYPNNGYAFRNKALVYIVLKDNKLACENLQEANKYRIPNFDIEDLDSLMLKYCK